jgi:DNA-binding response OmpR family regulator
MKILLVEDEASLASFIQKGIAAEGYELKVAFDGTMG